MIDRASPRMPASIAFATPAAFALAAMLSLIFPVLPARSGEPARAAPGLELADQTVDAFNAVFGEHPGYRPVHSKGIVCVGTFEPAPGAAALTEAPHLAGGPLPAVVRLSDFAGIPTIPDGDPNASPRGLAVKLILPDGADTDILAHSYNGFPVATGEDLLEFLRAVATAGAGDPSELERFLVAHPAAREFAGHPKPTPASFATEAFYGVNAFRFTNAAGITRHGRYVFRPVAGEAHLDAADAAARAPDFLRAELHQRLRQGAVAYRLLVQIAEEGDAVDDATARWPSDRREWELGTLRLSSVMAEADPAQRDLFFTPLNLVTGIEPSGDPLLTARTLPSRESYRRRLR